MSTVSTNNPALPSHDFPAALDAAACDHTKPLAVRSLQRLVCARLKNISGGQILLDDGCDRVALGQPGEDGLQANIVVHDSSFYFRLISGGALGFAEAFMDGLWSTDDLPTLIRIMCRNLDTVRASWTDVFVRNAARVTHWFSRNTKANSKRNIHAHYDLGNDFFSLFLDPTMMYSSAMYPTPDMTLEDAQQHRLNEICRSLELSADDHVMEIGTGWGGMALHMAQNFGCRVTTTTISEEQHAFAVDRIRKAGLEDRVTVLLQDYRNLEGQYDKLVSLEMIEAVGPQFHDSYFNKCGELLKPGGRMLLQAITMPEHRYSQYLKGCDFIQKYIFPGGSLPSVSAMQQAIARNTNLRMLSQNDFADGYSRTLQEWRRRFTDQLDVVKEQGFSDRFIRMWDYYLAYCEGAFDERAVGVCHVVWGK